MIPTVTINDVELDAPGRSVTNSNVLMNAAPKRRSNRVRAGVAGRKGAPGFPDQRTVDVEILLDGRFDANGDPSDDRDDACESHFLYLRQELIESLEDDEGCVECVVSSNVADYSGPVQIDNMEFLPFRGDWMVFLEVTIPAGALEVVGGS